jgi:hypothetical protein
LYEECAANPICIQHHAFNLCAAEVYADANHVMYFDKCFDFGGKVFHFFYTGADGTLEYEYAPVANGSLNPVPCKVTGARNQSFYRVGRFW